LPAARTAAFAWTGAAFGAAAAFFATVDFFATADFGDAAFARTVFAVAVAFVFIDALDFLLTAVLATFLATGFADALRAIAFPFTDFVPDAAAAFCEDFFAATCAFATGFLLRAPAGVVAVFLLTVFLV
jgi:hypothetical protein